METIPQSDPVLLAYAAGFIDGEACLTISRRAPHKGKSFSYGALLIIVNTGPRPLALLKQAFGGFICEMAPLSSRWRLRYRWALYGKQMAEALQQMLPYLIIKRAEAELLLRFYATIQPGGGGRTGLSEAEQQERESLYQQSRALKKIQHNYR